MTKLLSKYSVILIFFVATVIVFLAGCVAVFALWGVLNIADTNADFWGMLSAIATAFAASTVLGTVFVAYIQLSEVYNSRYIDVANKLFDELNSPENIEARRWVFNDLPDDPVNGIKTISEDDRDRVKKVLCSAPLKWDTE